MIEYSKHPSDQVDMIAACLAGHFLRPLFDFCNEKNYFVYLGSLAEIREWAQEFYNQYHREDKDWKGIESYNRNIIDWGNDKISAFYNQYANHPAYAESKSIHFISQYDSSIRKGA